MKSKLLSFILINLIFCISCIRKPNDHFDNNANIELRSDFSIPEFEEALIGKWISVHEVPGKENFEYLELNRRGEALIKLKKESNKKTFEGEYSLKFKQPIQPGWGTEAILTIKSSVGEITLPNLSYAPNNFVIGLSLSNVCEPYAVLQRIED